MILENNKALLRSLRPGEIAGNESLPTPYLSAIGQAGAT
jgi:hypothetical protein